MEESIGKGASSLRQGGFKSSLSERSTPRSSTFRRLISSWTPRREARNGAVGIQWFRSNLSVYLLLLIAFWAYLGFYVQSWWAHGHNKEELLGFSGYPRNKLVDERNIRRDLLADDDSLVAVRNEANKPPVYSDRKFNVILAKGNNISSRKKRSERARFSLHKMHGKPKATMNIENSDAEGQEQAILLKNSTYGSLVGPFGLLEDRVLKWSPEKQTGTCDRKGDFARLVRSRRLVLIFHELSMTGAPISMMELATELLNCGATVSAVVLSKKGGLMSELARRRIKVIEDRADISFKTAMKADLVIAGSAVCASWIDQYIDHFPAGGSQIAWWIMENRREYFERSKHVLHRVKMLIFLSELQSKQWLNWCEEENIKLRSRPSLVPLAVSDELAFVAGIPCSLNTPSTSPNKMLEKRRLLRDAVREEMGLKDNDVLVMSLSSINAGKGQLLLLESANLLVDQNPLDTDSQAKKSMEMKLDQSILARKHHLRGLLPKPSDVDVSSTDVLFDTRGKQEPALRILIGSIGSKSNKAPYVQTILRFLSQHSKLAKRVLWTPSTTHVSSLYSAADVYVMNSQGVGETFGRVTVEAMAYGLPVLGTNGGGTKEIVEQNVSGLFHPMGRPGSRVLAENLRYLLNNTTARKQMGMEGRKLVKKQYLKQHMYGRFGEVLSRCMRRQIALSGTGHSRSLIGF